MKVNEAVTERRTIRKFAQEPLTKEMLKKYIDAARLAPSAANLQPLKYVGVINGEMNAKVFATLKWAGYLKGEYTPKENERPTGYIVACVDNEISKAGYDMDVGAAVENIILSSLEDGVGTCWLGSVDRKELAQILGLADNLAISCVVALGYPAEKPKAAKVIDGDIKYYLEDGCLNVPKRDLQEVVLDII